MSSLDHMVGLLEAYVSGERAPQQVHAIERELAKLQEDERFDDLRQELSMIESGEDQTQLEERLAKECSWAIRTLRGVCVYRDCAEPVVTGARHCRRHFTAL